VVERLQWPLLGAAALASGVALLVARGRGRSRERAA
jgi:hypothetical protein